MERILALDHWAWRGGRPRSTASTLDMGRLVHGSDWARLPQSLRRRFEAGHGPAVYRGAMSFETSVIGAIFAVLARAFGAPLTGRREANVPVDVDVRAVGDGVAWARRLDDGHCIRSVKSAGPGGTVLERTDGGLGMVLYVSIEDEALVFTSRSFFLEVGRWRVTIPGVLTPGRCRVEHRAIDDGWFRFSLTMIHPLWGTTFRQTGIFTDSQEQAP